MEIGWTDVDGYRQEAERRGIAPNICLLYTSDAADERSSVDLGGRRIIKKKKNIEDKYQRCTEEESYITLNNAI